MVDELFRELKKLGVIIPDEDDVREYIEEHEDMKPLVLHVAKKARLVFPENEDEND